MSRIPECDDYDDGPPPQLWHANFERQVKGKRGQAFLRELLAALEALPERRLIANAIAKDGAVCALGSLALKRRVDAGEDRDAVLAELATVNVDQSCGEWDGEEMWSWAQKVLAAPSMLAWSIPSRNDEDSRTDYVGGKWVRSELTPEQRWERIHRWVSSQLLPRPADQEPNGQRPEVDP